MSRRNKLEKFAALETFPNVFQNFTASQPILTGAGGEEVDLRGRWAASHFGNDRPLVLELACGRGEYTLALARHDRESNHIGVDVKGARIYQGARIALEEGLARVAFLRTRIEFLHHFFAPGEIADIWITFPDPFPRKGQVNRRLTSPPFLRLYRQLLQPGGSVHLKTDDPGLYAYTLETAVQYPWVMIEADIPDVYGGPLPLPALGFRTYYERLHLAAGKKIRYVRLGFVPDQDLP